MPSKDRKRYRQENAEAIAEYQRQYRERRREYVRALNRASYARNSAARRASVKARYVPNPKEKLDPEEDRRRRSARTESWRKRNKPIRAAQENARRAAKMRATPAWANPKKIERIYMLCGWLSRITGKQFHVDHVVSLRAKDVCGLHVDGNLQILSREENCAKKNKWKPYVDPHLLWGHL